VVDYAGHVTTSERTSNIRILYCIVWRMCCILTVRCWPSNISGAIHPSVPATPDRWENDRRPVASFLHRPKSEIMARTHLLVESGRDNRTLCGFISLCTAHMHINTRTRLTSPQISIHCTRLISRTVGLFYKLNLLICFFCFTLSF